MPIVAVGKSSFLARAVKEQAEDKNWVFLSHQEALAESGWLEEARCIVNFAFPPRFKSEEYSPEDDIDQRLAEKIKGGDAHYIMLSSRLVYGRSHDGFDLRENRPLKPDCLYGRAKMQIENTLRATLDAERLTILRLSNIFGYERGRSSFAGRALTSLAENRQIVFDISPFTIRDFLPVGHFVRALTAIAAKPAPGIYNLGAGFGVHAGRAAEGLIEGYGEGSLLITDFPRSDQFWLDIKKVQEEWKIPSITPDVLQNEFVALGRRLKEEADS